MQELLPNLPILFLLLFVIITFGLSSWEKITEWSGQISWLKEHFSQTIFSGLVPLLLGVITLVEVVSTLLGIAAIYHLIADGSVILAVWSVAFSVVALLMLMIGQRLAKDYEGAANLTIYFAVCLFGLWLLT